eukprot:559136-Amphidinium_carterae.1
MWLLRQNSALSVLLLACCAVQCLCHRRHRLGPTGAHHTEWLALGASWIGWGGAGTNGVLLTRSA